MNQVKAWDFPRSVDLNILLTSIRKDLIISKMNVITRKMIRTKNYFTNPVHFVTQDMELEESSKSIAAKDSPMVTFAKNGVVTMETLFTVIVMINAF